MFQENHCLKLNNYKFFIIMDLHEKPVYFILSGPGNYCRGPGVQGPLWPSGLAFIYYIPRRKSGIYWIQVRRAAAAAAVEISLWTR